MINTNFLDNSDIRKVFKFNDKYSLVEYQKDVSAALGGE